MPSLVAKFSVRLRLVVAVGGVMARVTQTDTAPSTSATLSMAGTEASAEHEHIHDEQQGRVPIAKARQKK